MKLVLKKVCRAARMPLQECVTSQTSDGEVARFRSEGDRESCLGTGAGESKSNSGKTEEVAQ